MGNCRLAIGEEEVEVEDVEKVKEVEEVEEEVVVREESRWNEILFWQSSRTATTELMARERRRWLEVTKEVVRRPVGRWRTEREVEWRRSACGGIRPTCNMRNAVYNI